MNFEWLWKRKRILVEKDLNSIEMMLSEIFQPVTPRKQFIRELRTDLVGQPKRRRLELPEVKWQKGFLVAGGIVSFGAMIFGGVRLIMSILQKMEAKNAATEKGMTAA